MGFLLTCKSLNGFIDKIQLVLANNFSESFSYSTMSTILLTLLAISW